MSTEHVPGHVGRADGAGAETAPTDVGRADAVRTVALVAATAALVTVPTLGPAALGTREEVARYDTAVTPPDYAFGVWAPIFAGCVATAAQAALPGRSGTAENRAVGWPLAGAFALCAAWSVASQSNRLAATPVLLPAAVVLTAAAHRRVQGVAVTGETIASVTTGLLLGWTSLAGVVNLSVGTQLLGADPLSRRSVVGSTAAVVAAAGGLATAVVRSRRGYLPLALTATWGLATTALDERRAVVARAGTALGAAAVMSAAAVRRYRASRPPR